jgi:hypothetical protein
MTSAYGRDPATEQAVSAIKQPDPAHAKMEKKTNMEIDVQFC